MYEELVDTIKNEKRIPNKKQQINLYKYFTSILILIILFISLIDFNKKAKGELIELIKDDIMKEIKEKYEVKFTEKIKKELKNEIKKEMNLKVCMCVIGKKENLYANEFVNYYKKLGYNHIFIYDNNDVNDEHFEDVLSKEISENFVSIIDYRGYKGKKGKPQFEAYIDCYHKNSEKYDWLSFYDFDEY